MISNPTDFWLCIVSATCNAPDDLLVLTADNLHTFHVHVEGQGTVMHNGTGVLEGSGEQVQMNSGENLEFSSPYVHSFTVKSFDVQVNNVDMVILQFINRRGRTFSTKPVCTCLVLGMVYMS